MNRRTIICAATLFIAACGRSSASLAADSVAAAHHVDDSVLALHTQQAPAFADTARKTMAVLLKHPETAAFDSLIVVQPQRQGQGWPSPVVCGRINGRPGVGGGSAPAAFIFVNRVTVFVLDEHNGAAFAELRAKECDDPAGHVLLK